MTANKQSKKTNEQTRSGNWIQIQSAQII